MPIVPAQRSQACAHTGSRGASPHTSFPMLHRGGWWHLPEFGQMSRLYADLGSQSPSQCCLESFRHPRSGILEPVPAQLASKRGTGDGKDPGGQLFPPLHFKRKSPSQKVNDLPAAYENFREELGQKTGLLTLYPMISMTFYISPISTSRRQKLVDRASMSSLLLTP